MGFSWYRACGLYKMTPIKRASLLIVSLAVIGCIIYAIGSVLPSVTAPPLATATPNSDDSKLAACYPAQPDCSACQPILNGSTQYVAETERRFINLPMDLYPKNINSLFMTVKGNATAGYISIGGAPGEALDAAPGCWSTFFEFDGNGEVDLRVKSTRVDGPDYFVRFVVGRTP